VALSFADTGTPLGDTGNTSPHAVASRTYTAGRAYAIFVLSTRSNPAAVPTSVSGTGITFTLRAQTATFASGTMIGSLWTAVPSSTTTTTVSIAHAATTGTGAVVLELTDANAAALLVSGQSHAPTPVTTAAITATLPSAVTSGNASLSCVFYAANSATSTTPDTGWTTATGTNFNNPACGMRAAYSTTGQQDVVWTGTAVSKAALIVEIDKAEILVADPAEVVVSSVDTTLKRALVLGAAAASFALTGTDATLTQGGAPGGGGPGTAFLDDSFTGAADGTLEGQSFDTTGSGTWSLGFGTNVIKKTGAGALYHHSAAAPSAGYFSSEAAPVDDYEVSMGYVRSDSTATSNIIVGVSARVDSSIGGGAAVDQSGYRFVYDGINGQIVLQKRESGSNVDLATDTAPALSTSQEYIFTVRVEGDQVSGYIDGDLVLGPETDTRWASGNPGFFSLDFASSSSVGFRITSLVARDLVAPGLSLTAEPGVFQHTAYPADLQASGRLQADGGSFTCNGIAATLTVVGDPGQFVGDSFSESGVLLTAHTGELGATWTRASGTGDVRLSTIGRIYIDSVGGGDAILLASGSPPGADYDVSADVVVLNSASNLSRAGIIGRANAAADTFYRVFYNYGDGWWFQKVVAGSATSLGATPWMPSPAYADGEVHNATLDMTGSTIRMLIDGVERASVTDTSITDKGSAGVSFSGVGSGSTGQHLDNVRATAPVTGRTLTAASGGFTLTGQDTNGAVAGRLIAEPKALALTGAAATLTYSGSASSTAPDIAYNTFESATLDSGVVYSISGGTGTAFTIGSEVISDFAIVADPAPGGTRGNVVRINYSAAGAGESRDRYFALEYGSGAGPGLGSTRYIYGEFFIPSGVTEDATFQRKLFYGKYDPRLHANVNQDKLQFVLTRRGTGVALFATRLDQNNTTAEQGSGSTSVATCASGEWHSFEIQLTMNSTQSANDGVLRLWINGSLVFSNTAARFTDPAWGASDSQIKWYHYPFGEQAQDDDSARAQEYRYWNNCAISTTRVGPYINGAPTEYVLTAEAQSVALTGQPTADLRAARLLTATVSDAFALTGQAAGLTYAKAVAGEVGAFTMTGVEATLPRTYVQTADVTALTLAGQSAGLERNGNFVLAADPASAALTGQDAGLLATRAMPGEATAVTWAGVAALFPLTRSLVAEPGAWTLAGIETPVLAARLLTGSPDNVVLGAPTAGGPLTRRLDAEAGSVSLTGQDATLTEGVGGVYTLTAETAEFELLPVEFTVRAPSVATALRRRRIVAGGIR
jgi:hypothetical protein